MIRIFTILSILLILPIVSVSVAVGETFYTSEFEYLVRGGRADAMGGAACASGSDALSLFVNPARICLVRSRQIQIEYTPLWDLGDDLMNGAVLVPVDSTLAVGLGYSRFEINGIPWYDDLAGASAEERYNDMSKRSTGQSPGGFGAAYDLLLFSLAKSWSTRIAQDVFYKLTIPLTVSGGLSLKFFRQSFSFPEELASPYEGHATDIDLGFSAGFVLDKDLAAGKASKVLTIAYALKNLFRADVAYNTTEDYRDTGERVRYLGFAYQHAVSRLRGGFNLSMDFVRSYDDQIQRFGAEYYFRDLLFVRAGIHEGGYSAGMGVQWRRLGVDYSFRAHEFADTPYRLTLSVGL